MAHAQLAKGNQGTPEGPLRRRPHAVADGPPQRIGDKGMRHLPGDDVWLVGERRASAEQKYYLANLPAEADLKSLAATIKARWVCEQARSSAAQGRTRPRPLRRPLMARSSSPCADGYDRLRLPPASSSRRRDRGKKKRKTIGVKHCVTLPGCVQKRLAAERAERQLKIGYRPIWNLVYSETPRWRLRPVHGLQPGAADSSIGPPRPRWRLDAFSPWVPSYFDVEKTSPRLISNTGPNEIIVVC